jgi:hypothetical protein
MVARPLQPVLVLPVYRGGIRFERALTSVRRSEKYFRRIVVSLNSAKGSDDERIIEEYREQGETKIEVIQTGSELTWMPHQYFWLSHLESTGESSDDWVYWFAHDDEVKPTGIARILAGDGSWPLRPNTVYLGPWGMRYDEIDRLYDGPTDTGVESWTSFPLDGPLRLPAAEWIAQQLEQPTYINMSGCVTQLASFQELRAFPIAKPGGMRIEMATAAAPHNLFVEEFSEPVIITYTSKGSDRTKYAAVARKDDRHMVAWLANYVVRHPGAVAPTARATFTVGRNYLNVLTRRGSLPAEDWRFRTMVEP